MELKKLALQAAVNAPDGSIPEPVFRFLWDRARNGDPNLAANLIRRREAPDDLVDEFSRIQKPLALRAAYLCRPTTSLEVLDEAIRTETRIGVLRAMARAEYATEDLLVKLCARQDLQVCASVLDHPNTGTRGRAAAAPVLAASFNKLTRSQQQKFAVAAACEHAVLDAALPYLSAYTLNTVASNFASLENRFRHMQNMATGTNGDSPSQAPGKQSNAPNWDPASLTTPLSLEAQKALKRIILSVGNDAAAVQRASQYGYTYRGPSTSYLLQNLHYLTGRITDRHVAKAIAKHTRAIAPNYHSGLGSILLDVSSYLDSKFGVRSDTEPVPYDQLVARAAQVVADGDALGAYQVAQDPRLPAEKVVELIALVNRYDAIVDAHKDDPLVIAGVLVADANHHGLAELISTFDDDSKRAVVSKVEQAAELLTATAQATKQHYRYRYSGAAGAVASLVRRGVISHRHMGSLPVSSATDDMLYYYQDRGILATAVLSRIIEDTDGDAQRIDLLERLLDDFDGTLDDLTETVIALDS